MSAPEMPAEDTPKTELPQPRGLLGCLDKPYHKRLPEFESFDRLEFRVVPRFKTSGLSGDEWRQHVQADFYFKGEKMHEAGYRDMKTALMMVGAEWVRAQEPIPTRVIEIEKTKCDQPSCTADAVAKYQIRRQTSDRGDYLDPSEQSLRYFRQFCKRHAARGDCSREDADDNYEPIGDVGPAQSTNVEESPAGGPLVCDMGSFVENPAAALARALEIDKEAREIFPDPIPIPPPEIGVRTGTMTTLVADLRAKAERPERDAIIVSALRGDFHDFQSSLTLPKHALVEALIAVGYDDLADKAYRGEYDDQVPTHWRTES